MTDRCVEGACLTSCIVSWAERRFSAAGRVYDRGSMRQTELARRLLGAGAATNEEERDVGELVAFAFDCRPEVSRLPLYRTLQSRKRIGPRGMYYMPDQKGQWWLRRRSWQYLGADSLLRRSCSCPSIAGGSAHKSRLQCVIRPVRVAP